MFRNFKKTIGDTSKIFYGNFAKYSLKDAVTNKRISPKKKELYV